MKLIVRSCQDFAVLAGRVANIEERKEAVLMTVSGENSKGENISVVVAVKQETFRRMKTKVGSFIMATTEGNFGLDILADGGNVGQVIVRCYRYTYSGAMSFNVKSSSGMVILCQVLSARQIAGVSRVAVYKVKYERYKDGKSETVTQYLKHYQETVDNNLVGKKTVFVTSETGVWIKGIA